MSLVAKAGNFTGRSALLNTLLVGALISLEGCATTAPQSEALLKDRPEGPAVVRVEGVPFVEQSTGHCGPATLAMTMKWAGRNVSIDDIAGKVMTEASQGSLQEDMIGASRREGMMAVKINGMAALIEHLQKGQPVIVFENLGLSWYQRWHYAVAIGYDLRREELILHSGPRANERVNLRVFERSWKHSDYWGLVVVPPGEIAKGASERENLRAAAGLELAKKFAEAEVSYAAILAKWPESLGARVGLGNASYQLGKFKSSAEYLRAALRAHPESAALKHNLRVVEQTLSTEKESATR